MRSSAEGLQPPWQSFERRADRAPLDTLHMWKRHTRSWDRHIFPSNITTLTCKSRLWRPSVSLMPLRLIKPLPTSTSPKDLKNSSRGSTIVFFNSPKCILKQQHRSFMASKDVDMCTIFYVAPLGLI